MAQHIPFLNPATAAQVASFKNRFMVFVYPKQKITILGN